MKNLPGVFDHKVKKFSVVLVVLVVDLAVGMRMGGVFLGYSCGYLGYDWLNLPYKLKLLWQKIRQYCFIPRCSVR